MSPAFGAYPAVDVKTAGDQVSSTYEGRHITVLESELTHPYHAADALVDKGDPVVIGEKIVGIALESASAATDRIAVDTEGIYILEVSADDDSGGSAIAGGDALYIDRVSSGAITAGVGACGISKRVDISKNIPFGYALGVVGSGIDGRIAVKIHWDPTLDSNLRMDNRAVVSGGYGKSMFAYLDGGSSEGLSLYLEGHLTAALTDHTYNLGSWINVDAAALLATGFIVTPFEGGIYAGDNQDDARVVFAGQHMAILNSSPASLHAWRLNTTQTITALIAAANPGSVGYVAAVTESDAPIGYVPMFDIVGVGLGYVRVYADTD